MASSVTHAIWMLALLLLSSCAPPPPPTHVTIELGGETWVMELAVTPAEIEQGLMHREAIPEGTGMIFKWNPYKFNPRTQEKGIWEYDIGAMRLALKKPSLKFSDVKKMDNDIKAKWKKSKQNKKNADAAEDNDGKPEDAAEE